MGKRGPKPGFKKARELAAASAAAVSAPSVLLAKTKPAVKAPAAKKAPAATKAPKAKKPATVAPVVAPAPDPSAEQPKPLTAADRENPDKLSGDDLRALAHRRGLAKSVLATMPDEKIRMELRYITNRQYSSDDLA